MEQTASKSLNASGSGTLQMDLTGLAICAVITALAYFTVIEPVSEAQASRRIERVELTNSQELLTRRASVVSLLAQDLANMKRAASNMPAFQTLPAQQSNQRLADLTSLAAQSSLNVDEMRTASAIAGNRFQIVPIHLAGRGTFQNCTSFLHHLRRAFPDTSVSSLKIAKQPDMSAEHTTFRLQLSWYAAAAGPTEMADARPR
jgi:Tfp pilus assembly protein PilO